MALLPAGILPWIEMRFLDDDGAPLALGYLETYAAGTTTPLATYSDVDLTTANETVIQLDAGGRPPDPIYLSPTGYKFIVKDADDVARYTYDNVEDVGQVFSQIIGVVLSEGGKEVVSGYTVLTTDRLVTVDSTGGPNPCVINLPAASEANLGTVALAVTPNGADTIDTLASAYTVPVSATPVFPSIQMVPDGTSAWYILASHGL
jgi:hypothetical protein